MNADEIVRVLRDESVVLYGGGRMLSQGMVTEAADLIKLLQAQLTEKDLEIEVLEGRAENQREYLMSLRRQLIASQRRAQDARNELCQKCGRYREAHKGACDGCRWMA